MTVTAGSVDADVSNTLTALQDGDWLGVDRAGVFYRIARIDFANDLRSLNLGRFTSAPTASVAGGLITAAHGLGAAPKFINVWAICTVDDQGYSVNDELNLTAIVQRSGSGSLSSGFSIYADATNIYLRNGTDAILCLTTNKLGTGTANLTRSSWNLRIEASL